MASLRDFVEEYKEGSGYEYMCIHGDEFSKETLLRIVKDLLYGIYDVHTHSDLEIMDDTITTELTDYAHLLGEFGILE